MDNYPCKGCKADCKGWDAIYCCDLCKFVYSGETPCDTCEKENKNDE